MRIEIVGEDDDPLIETLWNALYPQQVPNKLQIYMSMDLGPYGNERGMVINLNFEGTLQIICPIKKAKEKLRNPSFRK